MSSLHSTIRTAFLLACSCSMLWMCTKDKEAPKGVSSRVTVTTTNVTGMTADSALSGGTISYDGGDSVMERGVCWGLVDTPSAAGPDRTVDGGGKGSFSSRVKPLKPNTSYFLRAYAKSRQGFVYGNAVAFKTPSRPPTLVTEAAANVTNVTATLVGTLTSDGGSPVTKRGFYWSATNTSPTQADNVVDMVNGLITFNSTITGLQGGRTYYFRAWATNGVGTAVASNVMAFTTQPPKAPVMGALSVGALTRISADAISSVTSDEGSPITEYGFCWSTSPNPTYQLPTRRNFNGIPSANFNATLPGLAGGTNYYIRSYAVNAIGAGYSTQQVFQTSPVILPTVTMVSAGATGMTTANVAGNVSDDGGSAIIARGFIVGLTNPPSGPMIPSGAGIGNFPQSITSLSPGRNYFARAYATNALGTAYSPNILSFTTTPASPPTVITADATGITITSATLAGNVTSDGGSAVTQRGFYWSATNTAPTQADNILNAGNGTGAFNAPLSGLLGGRTYYFRAWATNGVGTAVASNVITFSTQPPKAPVLGALTVGTVTRISADAISSVTSSEGATVTEYGFCWSTSPNPTYQLPTRRNFIGNPTGNFNANLTGLAAGTTYYLRSYAVNTAGVGYSTQQVFQTSPVVPPTVTMTAATGTGMTTGNVAGNVSDDGGSTIVARGFMVGLTTPPSGPMIASGAGLGNFNLSLGSLTPGRTYYARTYATNALGTTALSPNILSFTTTPASPPVVTTNAPSSITASSFSGGGNVLSDGGAPITERGLVYGTSPNPNVSTGVRVPMGTGLGGFAGSPAGLASNQTFYVRAYATNGSATGYGAQQIVLTLLGTPSLQSPANGAPVGCCYPGFLWGAVSGASLYEIQFARNTGFTGTLRSIGLCGGSTTLSVSFVNVGSTSSPTFCINSGSSANNGTWYWRVRALSSSNTSAWSATRVFTYTR